MAVPKFYRVTLCYDILFPKASNVELNIRTEFKMLEENLVDSRCTFEPSFSDEFSNALLTVIPVSVFINRSVSTSEQSISGLAIKAERMPDCANYNLQSIAVDCLIPADENELNRKDPNFASDFKKFCLDIIRKQLCSYVDKLISQPDVALMPMHLATSSKVLSILVPSEANHSQRLAMAREELGLQNELLYGDIFSDIWSIQPGGHLINPHSAVALPEPVDLNAPVIAGKSATVEVSIVPGYYRYFRYNEDSMNDSGWGCAYRSLQSVCSWFRMQSYTDQVEPSHQTIQKVLVDIGDKDKTFIGSTRWIGSLEVGFILENYLGIKSRILNVSSGDELDTLASSLIQHFRTDGAPVMIGGGVLAHTIVGVFLNRNTGVVKYLVLDPHYSAPSKSSYEDELKVVTSKGWVGWKDMSFWKKGEFYNLCLPLRPKH